MANRDARPDDARPGNTDLADLRDLAYIAVGLGVMGFQRAQVRRRELASQLSQQRPELESQVQAQVEEARRRLADLIIDLGEQLRPGADTNQPG